MIEFDFQDIQIDQDGLYISGQSPYDGVDAKRNYVKIHIGNPRMVFGVAKRLDQKATDMLRKEMDSKKKLLQDLMVQQQSLADRIEALAKEINENSDKPVVKTA